MMFLRRSSARGAESGVLCESGACRSCCRLFVSVKISYYL